MVAHLFSKLPFSSPLSLSFFLFLPFSPRLRLPRLCYIHPRYARMVVPLLLLHLLHHLLLLLQYPPTASLSPSGQGTSRLLGGRLPLSPLHNTSAASLLSRTFERIADNLVSSLRDRESAISARVAVRSNRYPRKVSRPRIISRRSIEK